jgi:hypothetical protein
VCALREEARLRGRKALRGGVVSQGDILRRLASKADSLAGEVTLSDQPRAGL